MHETLTEDCNVLVRILRNGVEVGARVGHNVWTNTGREYSALLKTYKTDGTTPFRSDRIAYVGLGSGTQPEFPNVNKVVLPVAFHQGTWLKKIEHARTIFPDAGSRLVVRYTARFGVSDFPGQDTFISECGLFTDGHPVSFAAGDRPTNINQSAEQSPVAYHTFAPIPKTPDIEIELIWELRH